MMKELNQMLGIDIKLSTAYHPQTDSQTERMNQDLEQYLRMFINHRQEQWPDWLATAGFAYNNKVQTSTEVLLFRANNGQDPHMGFELRKKGRFEKVEEFCHDLAKRLSHYLIFLFFFFSFSFEYCFSFSFLFFSFNL